MITIFHPSDFSRASESAFAHALKIALLARAKLEIMHVAEHGEDVHWSDFPGVRKTLTRWGMLPPGSRRKDVSKLGLFIEKIIVRDNDPVRSIGNHLAGRPVDLIVLASHQREGLPRWLHKAVAEPIGRESGAMTLFVPRSGRGFVSLSQGAVQLKNVLIPVDHVPNPQVAVDKAAALAHGLGCQQVSFTLVHVGAETTFPDMELRGREDWLWDRVVRAGDVVTEIHGAEVDRAADLIVLATQGHVGFLDVLRGSTTERVLRRASCPVLGVPVGV